MRLAIFLAFLLSLHPFAAIGQDSSTFPGVPLNSKTLKIQKQAEEVYERTNYKRAFFIYRNELAPIGDKYGQYMVGYMYLSGKGVPEDLVAASAWYRLAAERGQKEFVRAAERLVGTFDEQQRTLSDQQFVSLRKELGDLALLMKAIRSDFDLLKERTGSRLSGGSSPLTVVTPGVGKAQSGPNYYAQIERRVQARLEYIVAHTDIQVVDIDVNTVDLTSIEARINEQLDDLN